MPDTWTVLEVRGLPRNRSAAVSGALWGLGAVGVQEGWLDGEAPAPRQPWDDGPAAPLPDRLVLTAWFEDPEHALAVQAVAPWLDAETELVWRQEAHQDWEARSREAFQPLQAGPFVVAPPWNAPEGALLVDPGAGFGTGEHPTTRGALELLARAEPYRDALDIGCGSGILAIAAARDGAAAHGVDIDEAAVSNARHNAALNRSGATFDTRPAHALAPADLVLANLHAELIVRLAPELTRLARHTLILAGILADREPLVRDALPWPVTERLIDGEWVSLRLVRP